MDNNQLPADAQSRIEADAEAYMHAFVKGSVKYEDIIPNDIKNAHIAGATAEAQNIDKAVEAALHKERNAIQAKITAMEVRYLKQMQKLLDVLQKIVHAPVPANEREYISWFVTAKNIAGGAISAYEAENEASQWKSGKGKDEPKPVASNCGMCGKLGKNQYLGNQLYLCDECFEDYEKGRDQPV